MTEESTTTTNGANTAAKKSGSKRKARKKTGKKKASRSSAKSFKPKAKKLARTGKRPGKAPEIADKIRAMKAGNPDVTAEEIAKKLGCSVNYVYLKWGASKRGTVKKGAGTRTVAQRNGGQPETEFRRALRLVSVERARQLLDEYEALLDQFEKGA